MAVGFPAMNEVGFIEEKVSDFATPYGNRRLRLLMTEDGCVLDEEQRKLVEETIVNHCRIRGWELHAVNCRTNHCHVVVSANRDPDEVREQFKAWGTRKLKELEQARQKKSVTALKTIRKNWWTERGSVRYIGDEASLEAAIRYVLDGQ